MAQVELWHVSSIKKCDFLCTEYLDKRGTPALSSFWNIYIFFFFIYIYIWCTSIATFSHDDSDCVRAVGNPPSHLFHVFSSIHKQRWHHQKLSSKITLCFVPTAQISPPFFEKKKKRRGVFRHLSCVIHFIIQSSIVRQLTESHVGQGKHSPGC